MDLQDIAEQAVDADSVHRSPEMVPGRVLVIDGDVLSYKACDLEYSFGSNVEELKEMISIWTSLSGAEFCDVHLTLGDKGGREQIARVKKYQGNREVKDPDKRERVHELRKWMARYDTEKVTPYPWFDQEADDGMAQAMYTLGENGILMTVDKDLNMVPGLRISVENFEIYEQPKGYGSCRLESTPSGRKLRGSGTSWFWHQVLMGDKADNIPGLPMATRDIWLKYSPTKKFRELQQRLKSGRMPSGRVMLAEQRRQNLQRFNEEYAKAKDKKVGEVLAHHILETCRTDRQAYQRCLEAYSAFYGENYTFYSHDNVLWADQTAKDMLVEQARLLWMRKKHGEDVLDWINELES